MNAFSAFKFLEFLYACSASKRAEAGARREVATIHGAMILVFPVDSVLRIAASTLGGLQVLQTEIFRKLDSLSLISVGFALALVWLGFERRNDQLLLKYSWVESQLPFPAKRISEAIVFFALILFAGLRVRSPLDCLLGFLLFLAGGWLLLTWLERRRAADR